MNEKKKNVFDYINEFIENAEGSVITLITSLIPWTAPTLPAFITGTHLYQDLHFPQWVAVAQAISVEFLGLSAITTAFDILRHNKQQKTDKHKLSIWYAVGAYAGYLAIILMVNVVLGIPMPPEYKVYAGLGATGLLTLVSLPAFLITAVRQKQREIAEELHTASAERKLNKVQNARADAHVHNAQGNAQTGVKGYTYADFERDQLSRNGLGMMSVDEIQRSYNRKRRAAYNWISRFHQEHPEYHGKEKVG